MKREVKFLSYVTHSFRFAGVVIRSAYMEELHLCSFQDRSLMTKCICIITTELPLQKANLRNKLPNNYKKPG